MTSPQKISFSSSTSFLLFVFCFLVSSLLFSSFQEVEGASKWPELQQGTYEIKEGTLLSQQVNFFFLLSYFLFPILLFFLTFLFFLFLFPKQWKVASLQFDFGEEDLSFPIVVPCFECVEKDNYKKANDDLACVCDFSSKENCGSVSKGCPSSTCDSSKVVEYCDFTKNPSLKNWTELSISETGKEEDFELKNIRLSANEVRHFRFTVRDPCRGYKVKTLFHSGSVDLLMSTSNFQPTELSQTWSTSSRTYPDHVEVDLCPEFNDFQLGTYFLTTLSRSDNSEFDLHIFGQERTQDKAEREEGETEAGTVSACEDSNQHLCIQPGDVWYTNHLVDDDAFVFFRWDIKAQKGECKTLTVYLDCPGGDGGLAADWSEPTPNYYYGPNPQYQSEFAGSDLLHFQRCFEEDGVVPLYFTVNQWSIAEYYIRVSEKKTALLLPASELTQYQYSFTASRALTAECPGPNPQITWMCQDWRNYCKQFWPIYPAEDPQPFWPTPGLWRSTNSPVSAAMFSSLVRYDTPLHNRRPGGLAFSILLSNTLFGKEINYLTEEQLQNCTFRSGNVAFNKRGYALQGTSKVEKKKTECKKEEIRELVEMGNSYFEGLRTETDFSKILQLTFQVDSLKFTSTWLSCKDYSESLISTEISTMETETTICYETDTTSTQWLEDPCCNTGLLWKSCCLPRTYNLTTEVFIEPDMSRISGECQNQDCVSSYISDLIELNNNQFQCATFKSDEYPRLVERSQQFYIDCRNQFNIDAVSLGEAVCHSDSECRFGGFSNKVTKSLSLLSSPSPSPSLSLSLSL
jgi:hypothetical protein